MAAGDIPREYLTFLLVNTEFKNMMEHAFSHAKVTKLCCGDLDLLRKSCQRDNTLEEIQRNSTYT